MFIYFEIRFYTVKKCDNCIENVFENTENVFEKIEFLFPYL